MFKSAVAQIRSFKETITVPGRCSGEEFILGAVSEEPRVLNYIGPLTTTYYPLGHKSVIKINYVNRDVTWDEIYYYEKDVDEGLIREAVGNYAKRLIIITPASYDLGAFIREFTKNCMAFYPCCTGIERSERSFSNLPYTQYIIRPNYRVGQVMLKTMEIEVQKKLSELKPVLLAPSYPPYLKIFLAHNFLAQTVEYYNLPENKENCVERNYVQSAYGALIKKQCVCQGYSEAFKRMMDIAGIECRVISGKIRGEKDPWHAWNFITDPESGKSFHIDVTWDRTSRGVRSEYFCINDMAILSKRSWNRPYYGVSSGSSDIRIKAERYCAMHRSELLARGVENSWMKQEK